MVFIAYIDDREVEVLNTLVSCMTSETLKANLSNKVLTLSLPIVRNSIGLIVLLIVEINLLRPTIRTRKPEDSPI